MHCVCNTVCEVYDTEEPDECPAFESDIECQVHNDRSAEDTDDQPWLVFAPAGPGALNDVAHQRVV